METLARNGWNPSYHSPNSNFIKLIIFKNKYEYQVSNFIKTIALYHEVLQIFSDQKCKTLKQTVIWDSILQFSGIFAKDQRSRYYVLCLVIAEIELIASFLLLNSVRTFVALVAQPPHSRQVPDYWLTNNNNDNKVIGKRMSE